MGRTERRRWQRKQQVRQLQQQHHHQLLPPNNIIAFPRALFQHMRALGWTNDTNLTVRDFPYTGRGLCSKVRSFAAGDALIRLPLKCLITVNTLEADDRFKRQVNVAHCNKEQRISSQSLLALYLLHHQHCGDKSPLRAYLYSLPTQFSMPYFCPINELQCLPESILERTVAQNRKIRDSFLVLKAIYKNASCPCCGRCYFNEIYTLNSFKWAYFVVNSRSVHVNSREFQAQGNRHFKTLLSDEGNIALAPFLDLFNHSDYVETSAELKRSDKGSGNDFEYVLTLRKPAKKDGVVKPHSQIYISYGPLTNLRLLINYGFILSDNVHEYFEFSIIDIEHFIRHKKMFSGQTVHRNTFKFIREHQLNEQMFVHLKDGLSHNLHVVLHLVFKVQVHYPNVLNQVAFGASDQLASVDEELRSLITYKINEYQRFIADLEHLPALSASGLASIDYMQESVLYLEKYLEKNLREA